MHASFSYHFILTLFQVVRGKGNTLNNRFLPLSNIETDAVLSLDDDVCLTQQQIVQGFRSAIDQAAYYYIIIASSIAKSRNILKGKTLKSSV